MRARWPFMIPSIAATALSAMLAAPARADDMDSYRIICTDQRGRIIFNIPIAYRISIDPTGTIYSYTTDWLSDQVLTFIKGGDTSCLIASNRS